MKRALFPLSVFFACYVYAAELPQSCSAALRRALGSSAAWTMERRLTGSNRTLLSSGTVCCTLGRGIVWKTLTPFQTSVSMTTNSMVFADEDGERVKPLDELPYYAEIRRRTDAFALGDAEAFDGIFSLEAESSPDGGWKMVFTPKVSAMRRLFSSVVLYGKELPTLAVLTSQDGGRSEIKFKELSRAR